MHSRISENASGPIRIDHERAKRRNGENGREQSDEQEEFDRAKVHSL